MSAQVFPISAKAGASPGTLQRPPLHGGEYSSAEALTAMNLYFFVGDRDGEIGIYRIEESGAITFLLPDQFRLLLANAYVRAGGTSADKPSMNTSIAKFWLSHPKRRSGRIVFEPKGELDRLDYNLWRGYALTPKVGFQHQRRLLNHIFRIVCRRDSEKFRYLMKWLAWAVQNPHQHAEVVVVLKSEAEGSGKSTLGFVMLKIFGRSHGLLVDNKEQLLGNFNAHLETISFVLGEEVLWAGDPKTADALKSRVTAGLIPIEAKFRQQRVVTNRLHVMLTTNHVWAVSAGVNSRRYFVCDVSDKVAQDKTWFDPLYADLNAGGTAEFFNLLLNLKLYQWHPREVPKTEELIEQQIMSAGSFEQWLLACAEVDGLVGHTYGSDLGKDIGTQVLFDAYTEYTKKLGTRPIGLNMFGKRLTDLFGPSRRLPAIDNGKRPPGYSIPNAADVREAVLKRLKAGS